MTAQSSASLTGWYRGSTAMPVPRRIVEVRAARAASSGRGDGRYPDGSWWCSVTKNESKPYCSAC